MFPFQQQTEYIVDFSSRIRQSEPDFPGASLEPIVVSVSLIQLSAVYAEYFIDAVSEIVAPVQIRNGSLRFGN
jgi:hypothetical protein